VKFQGENMKRKKIATITFGIRLLPEVAERATALAMAHGMKRNKLISRLVESAVKAADLEDGKDFVNENYSILDGQKTCAMI